MYRRWIDVAPSTHARVQDDWVLLEELERTFGALRNETSELPFEREVEHAGARLLPIVLESTGADDAWYATFAEVMSWYLEDRVHDVVRMYDVVEELISGRFESWIAPTDDVARRTFAELGASVAAIDTGPPHDAIAEWTAIRRSSFLTGASFAHGTEPVADGHAQFIDEFERDRDAERAERIAAALLLARDSAARGVGLGFDQLAEWQAVVLGRSAPVEFRTARAFAKAGREVYELVPRADFERLLDEANDSKMPVAARAARVYLDICFFHPFDDGNARAARLALDYVLSTAGLGLRNARPLFTLARAANDRFGAASFAGLVARLSGPTTRHI